MQRNYIIGISFIIFAGLSLVGLNCNNSTSPNANINNNTATAQSAKQNLPSEEANKKLLETAIVTGPSESKVTIIEASDFECPACRYWYPEFKKVIDAYKDKVQFGYVAFPLSYHTTAMPAALAVEAANKQGKGWELYKKLFEGSTIDQTIIDAQIKALGLDMDKYNTDIASAELKNKIQNGMELLNQLGLEGTPTFYINGTPLTVNPTFEGFKTEIDKLLAS